MYGVDFLENYTDKTLIVYDKDLGGLVFELYSKRQKQQVSIRVQCKKKEVTKKFVEENLDKLREVIETDINK